MHKRFRHFLTMISNRLGQKDSGARRRGGVRVGPHEVEAVLAGQDLHKILPSSSKVSSWFEKLNKHLQAWDKHAILSSYSIGLSVFPGEPVSRSAYLWAYSGSKKLNGSFTLRSGDGGMSRAQKDFFETYNPFYAYWNQPGSMHPVVLPFHQEYKHWEECVSYAYSAIEHIQKERLEVLVGNHYNGNLPVLLVEFMYEAGGEAFAYQVRFTAEEAKAPRNKQLPLPD